MSAIIPPSFYKDKQHINSLYKGFLYSGTYEFKNLDTFGTMYGFRVNRTDKYQTNIGSFFSFVFYALMIACLAYYIERMNDRSNPTIQWNEYIATDFALIDMQKEGAQFMWVAYAEEIYQVPSAAFVQYAMVGVLWYFDYNDDGTTTYRSINTKFRPCKEMAWAQKLTKKWMIDSWDYGICMDEESLEIYRSDKYETYFNYGLFPCWDGWMTGITCATGASKWDIAGVDWQTWFTEKSVNIKDYNNPIQTVPRYKWSNYLTSNLKNDIAFDLGRIVLTTDRGFIMTAEVTDNSYRLIQVKEQYMNRANSVANRDANQSWFNDYNIVDDYYYSLVITPSNEKREIKRAYIKLIDVFAATGGIVQVMIFIMGIFYSMYNSKMFTKHLILNMILGKSNIYPNEYDFKKQYWKLTFRENCCWWNNKWLATPNKTGADMKKHLNMTAAG